MAKYLRTTGISSEIDNLIRDARVLIYIISPYLKLSDQVKELLNDKEREKVEVRIIFGKQELNPTEMAFLQNLKYVRLFFSKNLHAKCYLNEKKMIITSMNLYEFSQQNNREMGILVEKDIETDKPIYEDAYKDIESILHNADDFSYVKKPEEQPSNVDKYGREIKPKLDGRDFLDRFLDTPFSTKGYCIRTGVEIPFDAERPLSYEAYKKWNEFGDGDYPERFCHFSGEPSNGETTFNKPILRKNWKKAKATHGL